MGNTSEFHYGEYVWLRRRIVKISYLLNLLEFLHDLAYSYDYPLFTFFFLSTFSRVSPPCQKSLDWKKFYSSVDVFRPAEKCRRRVSPSGYAKARRAIERHEKRVRKVFARCSKRRSIFSWRKAHDAWIAHACVNSRRIRVINISVRARSAAISLANIVICLANSVLSRENDRKYS